MKRIVGAAVAAIALTCASGATAEVFRNGDFENGNTQFGSAFTYGADVSTPNSYAIVTDPSLAGQSLYSFGDHTTGSGNMLVANGGGIVWSQTVEVRPNTVYHISFFTAAVVPGGLTSAWWDNLGGGSYFDGGSGYDGAPWRQVVTTWHSGNLTWATFNLRMTPSPYASHAAFDSFSLGVPEPSTWAMMIIGFGGVGLALRRMPRARGGFSARPLG